MHRQLDGSDLTARLKAHARDNYLFIYSVMKGATLANAGYTLAIFFGGGTAFLPHVPFWIASFLAMILTYNATVVGGLILGFVPTWRDSVLPFTLAVVEFLLFSLLQHQDRTLSGNWYIIFALFDLNCFLITWNILGKIRVEDYDTSLDRLICIYKKRIKRDRLASGINAVSWLAVWLLIHFLAPKYPRFWDAYQWLLGIAAIGVMVLAIGDQEKTRKQIFEFLAEPIN